MLPVVVAFILLYMLVHQHFGASFWTKLLLTAGLPLVSTLVAMMVTQPPAVYRRRPEIVSKQCLLRMCRRGITSATADTEAAGQQT